MSAKFPGKVDFDWGYDHRDLGGGRYTFQGGAEFMNGLGLMIPHRYSCTVEGGRVTDIAVAPG